MSACWGLTMGVEGVEGVGVKGRGGGVTTENRGTT